MTKIFKIGKSYELQVQGSKYPYAHNAFIPISVWWGMSDITVGTRIGRVELCVSFRKLIEVGGKCE